MCSKMIAFVKTWPWVVCWQKEIGEIRFCEMGREEGSLGSGCMRLLEDGKEAYFGDTP